MNINKNDIKITIAESFFLVWFSLPFILKAVFFVVVSFSGFSEDFYRAKAIRNNSNNVQNSWIFLSSLSSLLEYRVP